MSIFVALLFPLAGALTLALLAACVALMVHYKYPRQRGSALTDANHPSVWVETDPQPEPVVERSSPRREFIQITRVNS